MTYWILSSNYFAKGQQIGLICAICLVCIVETQHTHTHTNTHARAHAFIT